MDLFSRTGMNLVGALLLVMVAMTVVSLWDVAMMRWFG